MFASSLPTYNPSYSSLIAHLLNSHSGELSQIMRTNTQMSNLQLHLMIDYNRLYVLSQQSSHTSDLRFYMPPIQKNRPNKLRFKVNINNGKELMIVSADSTLTVYSLSETILMSFIRSFILKEEEFVDVVDAALLPIRMKKLRSGHMILSDSQLLSEIPSGIDNELHATIASKEQIPQSSGLIKNILRLYNNYNQRKAVDQKSSMLAHNNNQTAQLEPTLSKKKKKQKNSQKTDNNNYQGAHQVVTLPCRVLLMLGSVIVDVWDPVECENVQFELSADETIEDLKWMIETYTNVPSDNHLLECTVYAALELFEQDDDEIDLDYQLFTHQDSPMVFTHRLKGG